MLLTARGPARLEEAVSIRCPTLLLNGSNSPPWMSGALDALAKVLPHGRRRVLEGQTHAVDLEVLARALEEFLLS